MSILSTGKGQVNVSRTALYLLGTPRLERDGQEIALSRRKALALLAYLAVTGHSHGRDTLATLLWPEYDQSRARASLRGALSSLKQALGEGWLEADRETVGLDASSFAGPLSSEAAREDVGPHPEAAPGRLFWLDVAEFQDRLAQCRTHGHPPDQVCPACLSSLAQAAALYRDDFLAGFTLRDSSAFDEWQFFQTEGLRREMASVLERLVLGLGAQGAFEGAIPYARRWVALDLLHEPAHRHLMRLYAWSGQRAAALRQYAECERVLNEELGVSPEEETVQLGEAIQERREPAPPLGAPLGHATPVSAQAFARKQPQPNGICAPDRFGTPHNLPAQLTPFVGRRALLAEIAGCLQDPDCRLLTLVGPGGSGKTRLALEAAAAQRDNYAHGVYWVPLASIDAPEAIVPAVASALGFSFRADAGRGAEAGSQQRSSLRQQLLGYLSQKNLLLLMDNVEHLLPPARSRLRDTGGDEGGAGLVTEMLEAAPRTKVLATSRVRLNVQGEHVYPVPGMDYPASGACVAPTPPTADGRTLSPANRRSMSASASVGEGGKSRDWARYSAVQLFLHSARRALPGFELADGNLADVVEICRLVAGMPLGILLAAAWAGMLSPAEIVAEIRQSLDFLSADLRDLPERQRSMRAVFDHSWNLLAARERAAMQALSVFRGGFTRQAAYRVAGATLQELRALMDRSLLQRSPGGRFEMHELSRQYAAEKLEASPSDREAVRERHSAYYTAALQQWDTDLKGPRQQAALAEIEADGENARAAWDWAAEQGQVEWLDRAMEGLCRSFEWRGRYQEGEAACRMAAEKLRAGAFGPEVRVLARSLAWQGVFGQLMGHTERARHLLAQSLALLEGPELGERDARPGKAFVLLQMGRMLEHSDREEARRLCERSLALYRALGDLWGQANALNLLGYVHRLLGAYDQARQLCEGSLAIRRTLGDQSGIADSLLELGWAAILQARFEQGERLIRESLAIRREIGGRAVIAEGLLRLGVTLFWLGRFAEAHSLLEESVAVYGDLGERTPLAWSNNLLGLTKAHLGQYVSARAQAEVALALYRESDERAGVGHALLVLGHVALAVEAYAEARQCLLECVALYREVGVQDELGWALGDLAVAAYRLGDLDQARQHLCESLRMSTNISGFFPLWVTLPAIALLLADRGEVERAVELCALASHYPPLHSRWFEDVFERHVAAASTRLSPQAAEAARARGLALDVGNTVAELLIELESRSIE
jgi:predicted ATPase/DNA-binding SARP family transcriptional activator